MIFLMKNCDAFLKDAGFYLSETQPSCDYSHHYENVFFPNIIFFFKSDFDENGDEFLIYQSKFEREKETEMTIDDINNKLAMMSIIVLSHLESIN